MSRTLSLFALLAAFTLGARADDEKKPKLNLSNAEALFKLMDANSDGKVTKEEFKKGWEKLADKIEQFEKIRKERKYLFDAFVASQFRMLDANTNGSLSSEEFKKLPDLLKGKKNEK